jgi:hypothetical protein
MPAEISPNRKVSSLFQLPGERLLSDLNIPSDIPKESRPLRQFFKPTLETD